MFRLDMTWDPADEAHLRRLLAKQSARTGRLPHVIADPVDAFIWDFGHSVLDHAHDRAPVDTGRMRGSLRFDWGPWGGSVSARKPGAWVDQGTKPHWPPVSALRGWAQRHNIDPFLVARKIAREGTQRTGWFTDAIADAERELPRRLRRCTADIQARWT